MANITKIYEIQLQGQQQLVEEMQKVNKQFDDAKKRFKDLKAIVSAGGLSSGDMEKYKLELQAAKVDTEKLRQETIRLNNEGKALANINKAQKTEQEKVRQEVKLTVSQYRELSKLHIELRNQAKEAGVVFGIESQEFLDAAEKANKLDLQLKKLDTALGQFNRNVGNYPKEIKIGGISAGVMNQLQNAGLGDLLGNQIDHTKGKVIQLNSEFAEMKAKLDQARADGVQDLNALESELIQNRVEADNLNNEIQQSQVHLNGLGSVGTGVFGRMGSDIKGMILGYVGLQAAMSSVQELTQGTKELSDQTTNLEIELDKTAGGAEKVVSGLAKINTRTKLTVLEDMANIAAKAGVAEGNIVGVTESVDKIKTAFGKDFGDVEQGTESLIKIINIFEGADHVNGENLLKTGNAVRTLANESVASVPFITDFTKRMAGLKGITDISLPSVLGLASGFEQFGQTSEVSSTALVKIIPKIAKDVDKFAKIAGMTNAEFKKMINENPAEALIKVSEGLIKNKKGISEISTAFADSELGSGRIASVLGVLGKNADTFRKSIDSAGKSYQNTTNIESAFKAKNENLAGTLDKISKKFSDLANNKGFINFISTGGSVILGFISIITSIPFGWWIGMLGFLTLAYWGNITAVYASIVAYSKKIAIQAYENTLIAIGNGLIIAGTILEYAQAVATGILTAAKWALVASLNAVGISTAGLRTAWLFLNTTFLATPLGWILLGVLAIGAATSAFSQEVDKSSNSLKKHGEQLKLTASQLRVNAEIERRATESTSERIAKLKVLTQIAGNLENSDIGRKKAMEELISIDSRYKDALDGNIVKTDKLRQITDDLTRSILLQAKAEATRTLLVEKQKKSNRK